MNKGIIVFGGSFDPPHLGHLITARWAFEFLGLPVHFVPVAQPVHKEGLSSAGDRLNMLKLALTNQEGFILDDTEFKRSQASYTADTLAVLARLHKLGPDQLYLLVGADSASALATWHRPDEIARLATLLISLRDGSEEGNVISVCTSLGFTRVQILDAPRIAISSTLVRKRAAAQKPVHFLVPEAVGDYIMLHKLYQV